jgi:hypothetical protein
MGKKGGNNKQVKRTKASTLTKKVVFGKGGGTHKEASQPSNETSKRKGKTLKQQRRASDEFQQRANELRERSIGLPKTKLKDVPSLQIKPATFQLPSKGAETPQPPTFSADKLLEGEKATVVKPYTVKPTPALALSNRFDWLENDEILEDGTHSILKMEVKPATFTLPSR